MGCRLLVRQVRDVLRLPDRTSAQKPSRPRGILAHRRQVRFSDFKIETRQPKAGAHHAQLRQEGRFFSSIPSPDCRVHHKQPHGPNSWHSRRAEPTLSPNSSHARCKATARSAPRAPRAWTMCATTANPCHGQHSTGTCGCSRWVLHHASLAPPAW